MFIAPRMVRGLPRHLMGQVYTPHNESQGKGTKMKKFQRAIVLIVAIAVAGIAPLVGFSSAQAADSTTFSQGATAPAERTTVDDSRAGKKATSVSIRFKCVRQCARFTFVGKVSGSKRKIVLQRSNTKKGNYKAFKKTKTTKKGNYNFGALNREGWYRVKAPATKKFKAGTSNVIEVTKG